MWTYVSPGKHTTSKGRIRDDRNAELPRELEQPDFLVFDVERERRVLDLQRGDRVHGVRATERVRGTLGEAEIFYLARSVAEAA